MAVLAGQADLAYGEEDTMRAQQSSAKQLKNIIVLSGAQFGFVAQPEIKTVKEIKVIAQTVAEVMTEMYW